MNDPFSIAVQGLAPGSTPIRIATQGLILTVEPAEDDREDVGLVPLRSYGQRGDTRPYDARQQRRDLVVNVEGCNLTASATAPATHSSDPSDPVLVRLAIHAMLEELFLEQMIDRYDDSGEDTDREVILHALEDIHELIDDLRRDVDELKKPTRRTRKK